MANVLGIGIATLDIINFVESYPNEDSEIRATNRRITRGGNVTNSLSVIAQAGHNCFWAGNCSSDTGGDQILSILKQECISVDYIKRVSNSATPTSYVVINETNGSRTIVHYRDLAEFSFDDFKLIPLKKLDWLHFEGRAVNDTARMMEYSRRYFAGIPISLEVEKTRPSIDSLFAFADLIFFSKNFVTSTFSENVSEFLAHIRRQYPNAVLVCAWGQDGSYALPVGSDTILFQPSYVPEKIVDTLGAGDTFIAGFIIARLANLGWEECLRYATKLAGRKCGQIGFANLVS